MRRKSTVVVVDDHPLFRAGVIQTLELDPDLEVVGEGGSAAEAHALATRLKPDIMLLDVTMPGNGVEAVEGLVRLEHPPKVMMLTVSEEDEHVMGALGAGANGYVLKGVKASELIGAVKCVLKGDAFVSPNLTKRLITNSLGKPVSPLASLTGQEERTLMLLAAGMSNAEIGRELGITESTVKAHVTRILAKLKVRNRVEATLVAERELKKSPGSA
ncbi:MAG: response regulator transcription factor [Pseudaminobacter sp.]